MPRATCFGSSWSCSHWSRQVPADVQAEAVAGPGVQVGQGLPWPRPRAGRPRGRRRPGRPASGAWPLLLSLRLVLARRAGEAREQGGGGDGPRVDHRSSLDWGSPAAWVSCERSARRGRPASAGPSILSERRPRQNPTSAPAGRRPSPAVRPGRVGMIRSAARGLRGAFPRRAGRDTIGVGRRDATAEAGRPAVGVQQVGRRSGAMFGKLFGSKKAEGRRGPPGEGRPAGPEDEAGEPRAAVPRSSPRPARGACPGSTRRWTTSRAGSSA